MLAQFCCQALGFSLQLFLTPCVVQTCLVTLPNKDVCLVTNLYCYNKIINVLPHLNQFSGYSHSAFNVVDFSSHQINGIKKQLKPECMPYNL